MSVAVTAQVLSVGKMVAFSFSDPATGLPVLAASLASDPTIVVDGGTPIPLSAPAATTPGFPLPFALYSLPSQLSPSATVTYSAAAGWASFASGGAPPATAAPVVNAIGRPIDPPPAPAMGLALNLTGQAVFGCDRLRRNLALTGYWDNHTTLDSSGNPAAFAYSTGTFNLPSPGLPNGIDALGQVSATSIPWLAESPNFYTVVWSESAPGNDSNGRLRTSGNNLSDGQAIIVERADLALNPSNGVGRTRVYEVSRPSDPANYALGLTVRFDRHDFTDFGVFGPGDSADLADPVSEVTKAYVSGSRVVRFMDTAGTNNSPVATSDMLRPDTDRSDILPRPLWATIAQANPVPDVSLYSYSRGWMVAEFTTAAPHGFAPTGTSGQSVEFQGCVPDILYASDGVTAVGLNGAAATIYVTSPTTFDAWFYHGNGALSPDTANARPTTQAYSAGRAGFESINNGTPFPAIFRMASSMGVDAWVNIPFCADDACVAAIARDCRDHLAAGLKVWVEYSNEIWNTGFSQAFGALMKGRRSSPRLSGDQWAALRAGEVHAIFDSVLSAAGRGGDVVRVYGWWWQNAYFLADHLAFCKANGLRVDALATAPYRDLPASLVPAVDGYDSDRLHDFWQMFLSRTSPYDSPGPAAVAPAHSHAAALAAAYPAAKLVCYEGSIESYLQPANANYVQRTHDFVYHPRMYETFGAYLASLQYGGYDLFCFYELTHQAGWDEADGGWTMYFWAGQPWGRGDGSDGKANNLDCLAATKAPTVQQDLRNVSVMGQRWRDWGAALPGGVAGGSASPAALAGPGRLGPNFTLVVPPGPRGRVLIAMAADGGGYRGPAGVAANGDVVFS